MFAKYVRTSGEENSLSAKFIFNYLLEICVLQ